LGKGLQIWLVEGRDFRSANNAPDGPEKTIWGREQLEWLKRSVLASDADFRVLVSPTPIVGPDRGNKADNHANAAFAHEGGDFRRWTQDNKLDNFFVCCGDRHWQYHSVDPVTKLQEFSCGPASDKHAGGSPGKDAEYHQFHRMKGGFLTVSVLQERGQPTIAFNLHDVHGDVVYVHIAQRPRE
jgi:alkaline phosphatase D